MRRTKVSVAVAALITLAGCVPEEAVRPGRPPAEVGGRFSVGGFAIGGAGDSYGYKATLTQSEEQLREQGPMFDKTIWQGVLIGAVAGALVGAVASGDAEDAVGGAIVGGSIGALAGMYVANKPKLYASAGDQLDSMISARGDAVLTARKALPKLIFMNQPDYILERVGPDARKLAFDAQPETEKTVGRGRWTGVG
jgi:uncharacterized protein YcfJ